MNFKMFISIKVLVAIQHFLGSDKFIMLFFLLINVKMPTIVGILTFMSRKNFMLNCFITSGPDLVIRHVFVPSRKFTTRMVADEKQRKTVLTNNYMFPQKR